MNPLVKQITDALPLGVLILGVYTEQGYIKLLLTEDFWPTDEAVNSLAETIADHGFLVELLYHKDFIGAYEQALDKIHRLAA